MPKHSGKLHKLSRPWHGPYRVMEVAATGVTAVPVHGSTQDALDEDEKLESSTPMRESTGSTKTPVRIRTCIIKPPDYLCKVHARVELH